MLGWSGFGFENAVRLLIASWIMAIISTKVIYEGVLSTGWVKLDLLDGPNQQF